MKLSSRIMSWILSPGAYAVWHSMGNPEEWEWCRFGDDDKALRHKPTHLHIDMVEWWELPPAVWAIPFMWFVPLLCWMLWPCVIDCRGEYAGAIGYLERHIIAGRALRLRTTLLRPPASVRSIRKRRNQAVFTKLLINQEVE